MYFFFLQSFRFLGHTREFKNNAIKLKFGTRVDWMNTWEFQNLYFWVLGTLFVLNLWGSVEKSKMA